MCAAGSRPAQVALSRRHKHNVNVGVAVVSGVGAAVLLTGERMHVGSVGHGVRLARVDPFAVILLAGVGAFAVWAWALARTSARRRADPPGLRSARQITDADAALESEDLEQLLAATNVRRLARGLPARTADDVAGELADAAGSRAASGALLPGARSAQRPPEAGD